MARRLQLSGSMRIEINPAALERLMAAGGADLVERMVALFLQHSPDRMATLRAGIDGRDWSSVERSAHSMKSSAAHLGLEDLRAAAALIEELASQGDLGQLRLLSDRLMDSFLSARKALTRTSGRLL